MSSLVSPPLVQPCLAKGPGVFRQKRFGSWSRSRPAPVRFRSWRSSSPGAAVPLSRRCCGHAQGALGATAEAPAASGSGSKARPLSSPARGPGPRRSGRHGGQEVAPCRAPPACGLPRSRCERTRPRASGGATEREGTAVLAAFSPRFTLCPGDGGGTWYIDLKTKGGSAGFGKPPVTADVVMSMSSADFVKMFTGEGQRPLSRATGTGRARKAVPDKPLLTRE